MNTKILMVSALGLAAAVVPAMLFAANMTLVNGGLGQIASQPTSFGVSVCNQSATALTMPVAILVTTNGKSATVNSVAPIAPGACEYSYLPYSELGMTAGNTYSVIVTIDPNHTVISNTTTQTATYSVTVPGTQTAQVNAGNETANVNAQSGNFFSAIWSWIVGLFSGK